MATKTPTLLSNQLLSAMCLGTPDVVTIAQRQLRFPDPITCLTNRNIEYNDVLDDTFNPKQPQQFRCWYLLNQLKPLLFQFYSYQQMISEYILHSGQGMVIVESADKLKTKDFVRFKVKEPLKLVHKNWGLTIGYLRNIKQINIFLKSKGFDGVMRKQLLTNLVEWKNNSEHCLIPICALFADIYVTAPFVPPTSSKCMETEGKIFKNNLIKSGLWTCQILHIWRSSVNAVDFFQTCNLAELDTTVNMTITIGDKLESREGKSTLTQKEKSCDFCNVKSTKSNKLKICKRCR
eukprot:378818_1